MLEQGLATDMNKAIHHWEEAAIGGNALVRWVLGTEEMGRGKAERAMTMKYEHIIVIIDANLVSVSM